MGCGENEGSEDGKWVNSKGGRAPLFRPELTPCHGSPLRDLRVQEQGRPLPLLSQSTVKSPPLSTPSSQQSIFLRDLSSVLTDSHAECGKGGISTRLRAGPLSPSSVAESSGNLVVDLQRQSSLARA